MFDRELAEPLTVVDDHTLTGRVVPWDQPADIYEYDDRGMPVHYREAFARNAFSDQMGHRNPGTIRKIELRDQHDGGLGKMGYALELTDVDDGLYGTFRVR